MSRLKLLDHEAFELLKKYSIPHPPYGLAKSPEEAGELAERIGFPVVLKVVSPDISHKTDVGGVVLGVKSREEAIEAYKLILRNIERRAPSSRVVGVLVQKMLNPGLEVIIGSIRDVAFGVVLMVGLGGIFTEIFRDVSFRVAPLERDEVYSMFEELKGSLLFKGYRGLPPVNIDSLVDIVLKLEKIMEKHEKIVAVDLNPVFAYPDKACVVDARFILENNNNDQK